MGGFTAVHDGVGDMTYPESRVLVIITGGTICMQPSSSGLVPVKGFLETAMASRPSFNDQSERVMLSAVSPAGDRVSIPSLRTPPTSYSKHIRYGALEFQPLLDSSSISNVGWTQIATTVQANYHLFDGFVILHGTDSLAYSASALSFMLEELGKPVVLTGSQASIFALQSDAVDNLLGSLIVAGTFVIPEVCLFFHHTLFRGNRTTKVSASAFDAFASPNCDPLARVTSLGVDVNWALVRRPRTIARFSLTSYLDTAHVACVRIFPGILPEMLASVLRVPSLRGLILETFGMGNAPAGPDDSLTNIIADACHRGIVIVNVSQCTSGFVSPLYAPGFALGEAGVVFGQDMTSEAALTKLGYLLAAQPPLSTDQIRTRMSTSLRGEMTETKIPTFSHPRGANPYSADDEDPKMAALYSSLLDPSDRAFTALGYAIRKGDLAAVKELLDRDDEMFDPGLSLATSSSSSSTITTSHLLSSSSSSSSVIPTSASSTLSSARIIPSSSSMSSGPRLLEKADYAGNTAVHLAAVGPEVAVLRELVGRGAGIHVRNRADNTPLFLAIMVRHGEAVALLREAGAEVWDAEGGGAGAGAGKRI